MDLDGDEDGGDNGNGKKQEIKTRKKTQTVTPPKGQDDIPMGNGGPITSKQATDYRKECSRLKIAPKIAKDNLKEHGINTVDEIPAAQYEERFGELSFIADEMKGETK